MGFLSFTYDRPTEDAAPLWEPGIAKHEPVAIQWLPGIACTSEQIENQCSLVGSPDIPWSDLNIAEIRVQSRKVYEVLNRIAPRDKNFFVRINPPIYGRQRSPKFRACSIFAHGDRKEIGLAGEIAARRPSSVIGVSADVGDYSRLISETILAVFCHISDSMVDHLAYAVAAGCQIVSSDAGSAEEYLSKCAPPGSWHVVHSWKGSHWIEAIKDLSGEENDIIQSSYIDQTPYIQAWKKSE